MNLIESLLSPAGRTDPFPLYAEAHRLGPVLPITDTVFVIVGYAAVNEVLRNPGFGSGPIRRANRRWS
ncbi:hypothetical protein [Kribbella jiaozuonensis]|uniref:hypothetical protein n=1 Tax=Kribbella jiaozuonensis TaxID=2575441 RepID=UPI00192E13B7|nr:hypothetical protein [Kribbella jiaozuonensis]